MSRTSSPIVTSYSAEHQIGTTKLRTNNPRRFVKVGQLLTVSENVFEECTPFAASCRWRSQETGPVRCFRRPR